MLSKERIIEKTHLEKYYFLPGLFFCPTPPALVGDQLNSYLA
jgi:hypothetical protein